jgi:general secretion pathway protein M
MSQATTTLKETFNQFWDARQERERQILIIAAVFFAVVLLYLVAIDPALNGRDELKRSLPNLHQQAAQMQSMAQELAAIPSAENRHEVTRELVETALGNNGLKAQSLSVNDGIVRAQFSTATMSGLQGWLLELQKSGGLFVEEIKITGLEGGLVSASTTLRQPVQTGGN